MEIDQSDEEPPTNPNSLQNLTRNGPLSISVSKLSASSRPFPSHQDFHFYANFPEFRSPVQEIDRKSKTLMEKIGASEELFVKPIAYPDDKSMEFDDEVEMEYVSNTNDEIYEGVDESLDEFRVERKKEEESGGVRSVGDGGVDGDGGEENGFQVVCGRKNKKVLGGVERGVEVGGKGVQVAAKLKPKVPFHIPSIPKPQDEYKINVNNTNQPFQHVWLQRSEDGTRFIHPLVSALWFCSFCRFYRFCCDSSVDEFARKV